MKTTDSAKALVRYLMAMAYPQLLSIAHTPEEENPFVDVDKKYGRRYCILSTPDLRAFRAETGISLTKGDILSCTTLSELEETMEEGLEYEKIQAETFARMVIQLTSAIGKAWCDLEMVEDIEEISDEGIINPAYIWPDFPVEEVE